MKKITALVLTLALMLSLTACGKAPHSETVESKNETSTETTKNKDETTSKITETEKATSTETVESEIKDEAWDTLESLGKIKTEKGIFVVSITMPADLVEEEITQKELDAKAGEDYVAAVLNDDGSITYKLTKKQHKAMLDGIVVGIEESLQKLVDDETYTYTSIKHNTNYSVFDITLSTEQVGLMEAFMSIALYMYAGIYSIFSGLEVENIVINYYNPNNDLITSTNSSDMK